MNFIFTFIVSTLLIVSQYGFCQPSKSYKKQNGARFEELAASNTWVEIRSSEQNPWDMTQMDVIPSQKWLTADPALVRPNRRACSQVLHTTSIKQVFSKCFVLLKMFFVFVRPNSPSIPPDVHSKTVTKFTDSWIFILDVYKDLT